MENTIDWGQGSVNNTNDWGKGAENSENDWGEVYPNSPSVETNIGVSGNNDFFLLLEDNAFLLFEDGTSLSIE